MRKKGSVTVEASYLIPTILIVIIMLEFLLFYMYDKVALWADTYYMALRIAQQEREDITSDVEQDWLLLCKDTLILYQKSKVSVKHTTGKIEVSGQIEFSIPFWRKVTITEKSLVSTGRGKKQVARAVKWK